MFGQNIAILVYWLEIKSVPTIRICNLVTCKLTSFHIFYDLPIIGHLARVAYSREMKYTSKTNRTNKNHNFSKCVNHLGPLSRLQQCLVQMRLPLVFQEMSSVVTWLVRTDSHHPNLNDLPFPPRNHLQLVWLNLISPTTNLYEEKTGWILWELRIVPLNCGYN